MDKNRLEQLKEKNKIFSKRKRWEENELLQDCLRLLEDIQLLENEEDIKQIIHKMYESFPINEYRYIDGAHELFVDELDFITNQPYYIVWDNAELPVIKCLGKSILKQLDDIFAVSFDTYIFDDNFTQITHSDESDRLWRYF